MFSIFALAKFYKEENEFEYPKFARVCTVQYSTCMYILYSTDLEHKTWGEKLGVKYTHT